MKKLIILFSILLFSCAHDKIKEEHSKSEFTAISDSLQGKYWMGNPIIKIDGCQYIFWNGSHSEIGLTHKGNCDNAVHKNINPRSYQFEIISQEKALLYDGEKLIGIFKFIHTELDSLIEKDNL